MRLAAWVGFNEHTDKAVREYFGYNPIFCVSAENIDDLFTQSVLSLPEQPCMIYFFEIDDYRAIDKALWYQYQHDENRAKMNIADYVKDTDDTKCVCYIVKELPANAFSVDTLGYKSKPEIYLDMDKCKNEYVRNVFNHLHKSFVENSRGGIKLRAISNSSDGISQVTAMAHVYKALFEFFGMTYMYSAWTEKKYDNLYDFSKLLERSFDDWYVRLTEWQLRYEQWDNPGFEYFLDKEVYYKLYDDIYNKKVPFDTCYKITLGHKPTRNELCPCGSGRKYKKCCGA